MTFEALVAQLPKCPGPAALPLPDNTGGITYVPHGLPEFIGPDLSPSTAIEQQPAAPKVIIVSAAGAVGKSTLANELASKKQAPIWDLAQASAVGENSLTGQLTTSFGFDGAARVSAGLANGTVFIIVDALDEARVKANQAGYEAFISNIAELAKAAKGPAFVLLGRTQTAETTWLLLEAARVPTSLLSIQPFTRAQAERYIEARVNHLDSASAKRIADHPQPFMEARDLVLNQLELAVGGGVAVRDEAVREFLGYAPVLETVAFLLAKESNYQEFIASLAAVGTRSVRQADRPLAVLEHVVKRLLEREQRDKLQKNIRPALEQVASEADWNEWGTLYSPDEQRIRLLGRILDHRLDACPQMPASVRARYEEQLESWLPEHPFLRDGRFAANKVFESYLFAIAMREYLTPLSAHVEQRLSAPEYKPTRLLADFYILLGEQCGREEVAERQIGILYDSLLAGETDSLRVRLSLESGEPEEPDEEQVQGEGEFELAYAAPNPTGAERVEVRSFNIADERGLIAFRRQLKEAAIITRGKVVLGGSVDDFEIGPEVDIRCGALEILATGVVVRAPASKSNDGDGVVIDARRCDSAVAKKPVVRGSLSVTWPGAEAYPWNDFATPAGDGELDSDDLHKVHLRFRRIVTSLRSHSKGSLARFRDKVEHRRVLKSQMGRALLELLVSDGILRLTGEFYHWVPERAAALLQVSWHDLRNRRVTPAMKRYFSEFIAANPQHFREP